MTVILLHSYGSTIMQADVAQTYVDLGGLNGIRAYFFNYYELMVIMILLAFTAHWSLYVPLGLTLQNSTLCPHSVFICLCSHE
jgi:hypothetical protein